MTENDRILGKLLELAANINDLVSNGKSAEEVIKFYAKYVKTNNLNF